jgi:glucose-1-phosphate cytidylyltransferase
MEETETKPKPMVLIDKKPLIWHLMKIYASQGHDEFIIATGYKGEIIHEWVESLDTPWQITALDTGADTQTGGRIKKCMELFPRERMMATYGDGLGNININKLIEFHNTQGKLGTVTAVRPPARFGILESFQGTVTSFGEKHHSDAGWINGGFFVLEPQVSNFIQNYNEPFEIGGIPRLVQDAQLSAFHHEGFWQPMDTLREKQILEEYCKLPNIPWLDIDN